MKTKMLIMTAIFTAVVAVCSQIQIPLAPVPINLATFAIYMAAGLLGSRYGSLSLVIYVLLGAIGVPVFTGFKGGFGAVTGPTGGFIVGYIFAAFVTGFIIEKSSSKSLSGKNTNTNNTQRPSYVSLVLAMVAGLFVVYLLGTIWFIHLTGWSLGKALMSCVVVFLPGDAVKIVCAAILIRRLYPTAIRFRRP